MSANWFTSLYNWFTVPGKPIETREIRLQNICNYFKEKEITISVVYNERINNTFKKIENNNALDGIVLNGIISDCNDSNIIINNETVYYDAIKYIEISNNKISNNEISDNESSKVSNNTFNKELFEAIKQSKNIHIIVNNKYIYMDCKIRVCEPDVCSPNEVKFSYEARGNDFRNMEYSKGRGLIISHIGITKIYIEDKGENNVNDDKKKYILENNTNITIINDFNKPIVEIKRNGGKKENKKTRKFKKSIKQRKSIRSN